MTLFSLFLEEVRFPLLAFDQAQDVPVVQEHSQYTDEDAAHHHGHIVMMEDREANGKT